MALVKVKVTVTVKDRNSGHLYGDEFETMIAEAALNNATTQAGRDSMAAGFQTYYPGCDLEIDYVQRIYE